MTDPEGGRADALSVSTPVVLGIGALGAVTLLRLRDPHVSGSYGGCPFLALTGQPCPGCGGLRAINDLTHLDVVGAASSNLLAVVLALALGLAWCAWMFSALAGRARIAPALPRAVVAWAPVVVPLAVVVFWIARVTPTGAWLAP